jgi:O-acetyl-ADP-ribose deacetylase (regulator of RNase III)
MSISYHHGNLLTSGAQALVNPVNCIGVMGKGLALQFKRAYPGLFQSYTAACRRGELVPGRMFTTRSDGPGPWIINFPTKRDWRDPSRLADVQAGLADLARVITELDLPSIAVPPLGAGLGGLDWHHVHQAIVGHLGPLPDVHVRVYLPTRR